MRCAWCDAEISGLSRVYVIEGYPEPRPAFGSMSCHNSYKRLWKRGEPIPLLGDRTKPHRCPTSARLVVVNATVGRDYPPPRKPKLRVAGAKRGSNFVEGLLK